MSRKRVHGRSSLSFATTDGILDIEDILKTNPWKSAGQFDESEIGSVQNVLNEFNDRMAPDRKPKDSASAQGREVTPLSKNGKGGRTGRRTTNNGEPKETTNKSAGMQPPNESKENRARKAEIKTKKIHTASSPNSQKSALIKKDPAERDVNGKAKKDAKSAGIQQRSHSASVKSRKEKSNRIANESNSTVNYIDLNKVKKEITTANEKTIDSPIETGTPSRIPFETPNERSISTKHINVKTEESKKISSAKCPNNACDTHGFDEHTALPKGNSMYAMKPERKDPSNKQRVGKYEKYIVEEAEKRKARKIQRHERKAERAMEEFSVQVAKIAKQMGYLGNSKSDDSSDADASSSSSSSFSSSSSSLSSSECSCSDSSCSCSYSCSCTGSSCSGSYSDSYGYTDYTLSSCSGCDTSNGIDTETDSEDTE